MGQNLTAIGPSSDYHWVLVKRGAIQFHEIQGPFVRWFFERREPEMCGECMRLVQPSWISLFSVQVSFVNNRTYPGLFNRKALFAFLILFNISCLHLGSNFSPENPKTKAGHRRLSRHLYSTGCNVTCGSTVCHSPRPGRTHTPATMTSFWFHSGFSLWKFPAIFFEGIWKVWKTNNYS